MKKEELQEAAYIGDQIERFLKTDIFRFIMAKADNQSQLALLSLAHADPENAKEIRRLQNQVVLSDLLRDFLNQGIIEGNEAFTQLQNEENEDEHE
jgi:hypothetical protein